jgi:ribosomal protein S27AE
MTREERIAQAAPLRAQGLTYAQIAERLGVSLQTVKRTFSDRTYETDRRLSREAKQRRTGTCIDCGDATRYAGHGHVVSLRCGPCGAEQSRQLAATRRGSGPLGSRVLRFLEQPRTYTDLLAYLNGNKGLLSQLLYGRLLRYGLVTRLSRGVYQRADNGR